MQCSPAEDIGKHAKFLLLPVVLALAGCISSSNPTPPDRSTTVVVPPGTTIVCSDGSAPPCH